MIVETLIFEAIENGQLIHVVEKRFFCLKWRRKRILKA